MTDGRSNKQAGPPAEGQRAQRSPKNRYYAGPVSDHFDGTVFFNPGGTPPKGFGELIKWQLLDRGKKWPDRFDSPHPAAKPRPRTDNGEIHVTMVGHATMLLQAGGLNILTDPVWSERVSPFSFIGPKRRNAPGIAFDDLPPIDLVLLTHNHYDHLDLATLKRLREHHNPLVLTPLGNDTIVRTAASDIRLTVGDWGDRADISDTVTVHFEPCHHWSARGSRDRRMALWSAFVIETPAGKIYHIGDTGYHDGLHYSAAFEKHGGFKLALLPIGAYEPRWFMHDYHQNPAEAVDGMLTCGAEVAVGHHWGAFRLTNEAIEEPVRALAEALSAKEVDPQRFRAPLPGETMTLVPGPTSGV